MKKIFFAIAALGLLWIGCRKNIDETTSLGPIPAAPVEASLVGRVIDSSGVALVGVSIEVAGQTYSTNLQGYFFVKNKILDQNGTLIKAKLAGYFDAFRFAYPSVGATAYVEIQMKPKFTYVFSSDQGAELSASSGGASVKVAIPSNGLVTASGLPYSGQVKANIVNFDPTDRSDMAASPGDLRGQNSEGEGQILKSYGMFGVVLTSQTGEPLNLAPNVKASISVTVPTGLKNSTPNEIPLWHFNEDNGYWIEEGKATLNGDTYVGEVAHFSFWNCDIPAPYAIIRGKAVTVDGVALTGVYVTVNSPTFGSRNGDTDSEGVFSGIVPANEVLNVSLGYECPVSGSYGPFVAESTNDIGDIASQNNLYVFAGKLLDCNAAPLVNGIVVIKETNGTVIGCAVTNAEGIYMFTTKRCIDLQEIAVQAFDANNPLESGIITAESSNRQFNIPDLVVCTTLDEYIIVQIDGITQSYYSPGIEMVSSDSIYIGASAQGSSDLWVSGSLEEYNSATQSAQLHTLYMRYDKNDIGQEAGCTYCDPCLCGPKPIVQLSSYPNVPGEYAQGTVSGTISKAGQPTPFSMVFRIKRD